MAVEVYWWPPQEFLETGHASMLVDGGSPADPMYLSAWPVPRDWMGAVYSKALFKSYARDVADEGGVAPHVVRLTKLNETAIKTAIKEVKGFGHYGLFTMNCAALTAYCLSKGTSMPPPLSVVTPWTLWGYAQALRPVYG